MDSLQNRQALVIHHNLNLSRRSKSDSEIYFHSQSDEEKFKSTKKNYGTLKPRRKKLINTLLCMSDENSHKKFRHNSLPTRCRVNFQRLRSRSLPSTIKLSAFCDATSITNLDFNFSEISVDETSNTAVAPVNDHLFVFNVVLAQQQQSVDMTRPRQYGRRLNASRNESSNESRLSDDSQTNSNLDESTNLEIFDSMLVDNGNSSSNVETNHRNNSSILSHSPRLEAIIRDFGPRFCVSEHDNSDGWPISFSRPVTCSFCCVGLFNFTRFSVSTIIYGGNFLIQFVILSFFFGIPFVLLQMLLGQKIKRGIVTMFKISPICKGIGISLLISHCIFCLYSSVSIGWMMIHLR